MMAEVLVEIKAKNIDQTFSYLIPKELKSTIKIGVRVVVPFGKQKLEGFVLKIKPYEKVEYSLKKIIEVVDENPVLTEEMLELGEYISKKTLCNLISCYQTMLPSALKAKQKTRIAKKYISYLQIKNRNIDSIKIENQKKILCLFQETNEIPKKLATSISTSSVNTLIKNGFLEEFQKEEYRLKENVEKDLKKVELTDEQKKVINQILQKRHQFQPFLLHGVTGSGKTEVYMHLIEEVMKEKKEAIVLVPEISLTPQLVFNFRKRFGSTIAILHSRLSSGEKYDEWRKIEKKEVKVTIGARSAIFAPFKRLGIIIVDEEHETTYKQENNPKYNAIDIALWRAKRYKIPVVMGSATPMIESYTRAQMGIYELCELKNRINKHPPEVYLVDMKEEIKKKNRIISEILDQKIRERLSKNEQIILLLNRRGYSTILTCKSCGYTHKCPYCDIPLTYHKTSNTMRCHYCGYGDKKITICPTCHSKEINEYGMGTEKLQIYIQEHYPNSKIIRMDNDTTTKKGSHERIIQAFQNQKYNILIGTQMIAKGLDFPNVTLVGVMNGDASLNIPDFRSGERTFQLLNQVAGRAGRAKLKGEVVIQGFNIDHYSIRYAKEHDYLHFYQEEMRLRKILKYSPYYNLSLIKIRTKEEKVGIEEANKIVKYLKSKQLKDVIILGPNFSSVPKINNVYQIQIIIKYKKTDNLIKELGQVSEIYHNHKKINVDMDMNPIRI